MKHCPRCQGQYLDDCAFCDIDGTPLVDGIATLQQAPASRGPVKAISAPAAGVTALIGILIGIVLCLLVYIAFLAPGMNFNESQHPDRQNTATVTASAPIKQIAPASLPSPSPVDEAPSPEESEASSDAAPAASTETSAAKIVVNHGPISTGTTMISESRTLITMKDGSSVEADAAWEGAEGIWYRRSGLVSFVERAKVEKISDLGSSRSIPTEAKP